jgi:hypothetical protein
MSLFLPILLLGFAQPLDQPVAPSAAQPQAQIENKSEIGDTNSPKSVLPPPRAKKGEEPFDAIEMHPSSAGPPVCFTIRSYYFERQDGLAPEFRGMTTCESSSDIAERNTKRRGAKLVPATSNP